MKCKFSVHYRVYNNYKLILEAAIVMGYRKLQNRQYLFLSWNWINPSFCVILYLLFNGLYFGNFQKEK